MADINDYHELTCDTCGNGLTLCQNKHTGAAHLQCSFDPDGCPVQRPFTLADLRDIISYTYELGYICAGMPDWDGQ